MMRQQWPRDILQFPSASVVDGSAGEPLFCGLRLRIGIEVTTPFVVFDDVSKGYDYYGNGVNTAARINHACPAGTTLISRSIYDALSADVRDDYLVGEVGHYELRGLKEPLHMYISVPKNLSARVADDDVVDQLQTFCSKVSPAFNEMAHSLGNAAALYMSPAETMGSDNNSKKKKTNEHSLIKIHDNDVVAQTTHDGDDDNTAGGLHSPHVA
jgi:adenylate cyclase